MTRALLLLALLAAGCARGPVTLQGSESLTPTANRRAATLEIDDPHASPTGATLVLADGTRLPGALQQAGDAPGDWSGTMGQDGGMQFTCLLTVTDPSRGLNGGAVGMCGGPGARQVAFVY